MIQQDVASGAVQRLDAVVVGAGFGGMYAAYKLRQMGLSFVGIERGGDVGGVWYWNRYPGARCDLMCIDYSYSFSPEIEQEWTWSEQFAAQDEILAYANFVADRLDLRPLFRFDTSVVRAVWDDGTKLWTVETDDGAVYEVKYCLMATGPLSIPKDPEFPGVGDFTGELHRAARWPHDPVSFAGKRVGLIGTGSTGIQIATEVAKTAGELYVFQRTPSFSLPMRNDKLDPEFIDEIRRNYPALRTAARASNLGGIRPTSTRPFFSLPAHQRRQLMEDATQGVMRAFADADPALDDYRAAVRAVNVGTEPYLYPGSPQILAQLLRAQDALILNEKHPEDARTLRGAMRGTRAAVHERDAYEFWLAMLPTRTARGMVVVDPPYEQTDERTRITATLAAAHRKWAHGVTVIWYPLKDRTTHQR